MKIRIINLKKTSSIFIKVVTIAVIVAFLGKLTYTNKAAENTIKFGSLKFSPLLNKEITLFDIIQEKNVSTTSKSVFQNSKYMINSEFELFKIADMKSSTNLDISKNSETSNIKQTNEENNNQNNDENQIDSASSIEENEEATIENR